ncbi:MAG TPA: hypothetical protein VHB99_10610 [Pirellulales bacterium]|nr:hypothetical protein [Pirellulales bacterium]
MRFALSLSSILLAAARLAADEPGGTKDFSEASPAELGIAWVVEKRDPKTGFLVGGKNATSLVKGLTEINGLAIDRLEQAMRPGAASEQGFLGTDETLLEVLAADNRYVVDERRLTHQQLARALRILAAIGRKQPGQEFAYRGQRYRINVQYYRGFQESPFEDGTRANSEATIENLSNGKTLRFSLLVPDTIERYGFYEGCGTPYRVEPSRILEVCDFLVD